MKNKFLQLGIAVILLLVNSMMMQKTTYAEDYNTENIVLEIGVNSYASIDTDCLGVMTLVNPGTGLNIKAATDRRYGTDSCVIDFGYNDDTQKYAITFGKTQNQLISKSNGVSFKDIDNSTSTTISTTGNIDDEKFCFNVSDVADPLEAGEVRIDPDTSLLYDDKDAPLGYSRCFNIQDINADPDEILGSDTAGICTYGECYFTLNLHANMDAYELENDFTKYGAFDKFDCTTPPCTDSYKVRLTLTTSTP